MKETTLVLFKPDAISKGLAGEVLTRFEAAGLHIRGIKMFRFDEALVREHYAHVTHLPFFPRLHDFMQQSPVIAVALSGKNAIAKVRELIGPTDPRTAAKGTIRGDFGTDNTVNVCHASDSAATAEIELNRFFRPGELF